MKKKVSVTLMAALIILPTLFIGVLAENGSLGVDETEVPAAVGKVELELFKTYKGVGYVTAGIGVRNTGRGTISLRLPKGAGFVDAWLYWVTLEGEEPKYDSSFITVAGVKVKGTHIGKGPDPCWPPTTGHTFRANVKGILTQTGAKLGGQFGITIGGMNTKIFDGRPPWEDPVPASKQPFANYVGLIIIFRHKTVPEGSIVQIYDGYYEAAGTNEFTYNWPARTEGGARFSHLTSDGQKNASPLTKTVKIGDAEVTTLLEKPALMGEDPSIMSKATHTGSLADTDTYNVGSQVPIGGGPTTITWQCQSDCITWQALVFWTSTDPPW
jgi:hypothetical protein